MRLLVSVQFAYCYNNSVSLENELIFLDPHTIQPAADLNVESDDSYHYSGIINRVRFQGLDPSIAVVR
jgi:hypothetical protein